jgi:hypothetical protein
MSIKALTCDTIKELDDGRAEAIINRALRIARDDLLDRGQDGKERTVTIKVKLSQTGEDTYKTQVTAGVKCPELATADHAMRARKQAGENVLVFQDFGTDDPQQTRIEDIDRDGGEIPNK